MRTIIFVIVFLFMNLPVMASLAKVESLMRNYVNADMIFTYVPRGLVVSFDEDLFFNINQDKISLSGVCVLEKISKVLKNIDNLCVIEGHTNNLNPENSIYSQNWELSLARANNIAIYLMRCDNINPEKLFSIGFGAYMPFHDNVSYTGDLDNRIDFVFLEYQESGND